MWNKPYQFVCLPALVAFSKVNVGKHTILGWYGQWLTIISTNMWYHNLCKNKVSCGSLSWLIIIPENWLGFQGKNQGFLHCSFKRSHVQIPI